MAAATDAAIVRLVPFGAGALEALARTIEQVRGGDQLAPVSVVVGDRTTGIVLRRALARRSAGLVGVRFEVLGRLAELVGAGRLGRRPLRSAVLTEAVRAALAEAPGVFAPVAEHPATVRALTRTVADLRAAPGAAAGLRGTRGHSIAAVAEGAERRLRGHYDEQDLLRAAAAAVAEAGEARLRELGHVVLHLPEPARLTPAALALCDALRERGLLRALVGRTGDERADADALALARRLGPVAPADASAVPTAHVVVTACDPAEEVRAALRELLEHADRQGVPLHRMALAWTAERPYAAVARDELRRAGLAWHGGAEARLRDVPAGRAVLGLLTLADRRYEREQVCRWLSSAPVVDDDGPVDAARWDAISRRAGVVAGLEQWRARTRRYREQERRLAQTLAEEDPTDPRITAHHDEAAHAERLLRFLDTLDERLRSPGRDWAALAGWARDLLDRLVPRPGPDAEPWEHEADQAVRDAVAGLAALADVGENPPPAAFLRAVEAELDGPAGRHGRTGEGLRLGGLAELAGLDYEAVAIVGLVEGLAPGRVREDPLLSDAERRAAHPDLAPRSTRQAEQRRAYLAALAAGRHRIVCWSRGELGGSRERLPSRWLLESASALEGRRLAGGDLLALSARPWRRSVGSFTAGLRALPLSARDLTLQELLAWTAAGRLAEQAPGAGDLAPALRAQRERHMGAFGRFTGRVGPRPSLALEGPLSPTRLQLWARCPFRYLLERALHVEETTRPERTLTIDALERGSLVHEILEDFLRRVPPRREPAHPWAPEERGLLETIAAERVDACAARGVTGNLLLWKLERQRILADLRALLDADERLRVELGVVPGRAEAAFGFDHDAPSLPLPSGRTVAFRGRVDRVDWSPDGTVVVAYDYKTGQAAGPRRALKAHPTARGQLLQLSVYGLAAHALGPDGTAPERVRAAYWHVSEGSRLVPDDFADAEPDRAALAETVEVVLGGIERGLFPMRPGRDEVHGGGVCDHCPYDLVCDRDRVRQWERLRGAPELTELVALTGEEQAP